LPAACGGGQENPSARWQKIFGEIKTPKTPQFFVHFLLLQIEKFLEGIELTSSFLVLFSVVSVY